MDSPSTPPAAPVPAQGGYSLRQKILGGLVAAAVVIGIGGTAYWIYEQRYIYTDKAQVAAPLIPLGPQGAGILRDVMVREGDRLRAGQIVASVGDEAIQTRVAGVAMTVNRDIGAPYKPSQPVVTMFEPKELRIVARIQEDKGLKNVYVGQRASFILDAFGSQEFEGTVESISQTNRSGDVVFDISDQREEQEYDVKIAYDVKAHPEFLDGMSARVWLIK